MKNLAIILSLVIFSISVNAQTVRTESRNNTNNAIYIESIESLTSKDYKTFNLIQNEENPKDLNQKAFTNAIRHEMIGMNYDMVDSKPDLLVSYTVYKKEGEVKGNFGTRNNNPNVNRVNNVKVKKGTLLIAIVDTKTGDTVWTGLSDGALAGKNASNEVDIIRAINHVFDSFIIN